MKKKKNLALDLFSSQLRLFLDIIAKFQTRQFLKAFLQSYENISKISDHHKYHI